MKGYIYTMFPGADPGMGWQMTDPIFGQVPTLGACVPNIRRLVTPGDHIFVISGNSPGVRQYIVGGFEIAEKINALAAFRRFPEYRLRSLDNGSTTGNIIVNRDGTRNNLDYHSNFEERVEHYIVGRNPIVLVNSDEVERSRKQTIEILSEVFGETGKPPERVFDIIGRWRRLDRDQIIQVRTWLQELKTDRQDD